jgi:hypothetical protein
VKLSITDVNIYIFFFVLFTNYYPLYCSPVEKFFFKEISYFSYLLAFSFSKDSFVFKSLFYYCSSEISFYLSFNLVVIYPAPFR